MGGCPPASAYGTGRTGHAMRATLRLSLLVRVEKPCGVAIRQTLFAVCHNGPYSVLSTGLSRAMRPVIAPRLPYRRGIAHSPRRRTTPPFGIWKRPFLGSIGNARSCTAPRAAMEPLEDQDLAGLGTATSKIRG